MVSDTTTVTRKGQITIPVEVRRALGIKVGDRVTVKQEGEHAILARAESVATRTAGIGRAYRREPPLTAEEEKAAAAQAIAEEWVESEQRSRGDR